MQQLLHIWCSLVAVSSALRLVHPVPPEEPEDQVPQKSDSLGGSVSLPETKELFQDYFGQLLEDASNDFDKYPSVLNTTKHKIVFGVMVSFGNNKERPETQMTNRDGRDVIRQTWMSLPGMCKLEDALTPGCAFFPVFVLGSTSIDSEHKYITGIHEGRQPFSEAEEEHAKHHDMVFLHGENENMNGGKSFAWFEYASRAYPWADYIVKLDVDSFPFPVRFLLMVPEVQDGSVNMQEGDTAGGCTSDTPYKFLGNSKGNFEHGGSLYMMSRMLALAITEKGTWWSSSRVNFRRGEDRIASKGVRQLMRDTDLCVTDEPHLNRFLPPDRFESNQTEFGGVYAHEPWHGL